MAKQSKSFEENMEEIELIIENLQNNKISLKEMINNYEKASKLINKLESDLSSAKQQIFSINEDGEMKNYR